MYGTVPMLIVPGGATAGESVPSANSPPERQVVQGGALTAVVASAAVMSSQVGGLSLSWRI